MFSKLVAGSAVASLILLAGVDAHAQGVSKSRWTGAGPFQESLCVPGNFPPGAASRGEQSVMVGRPLTLARVRVLAIYDGANQPPRLVFVEPRSTASPRATT